MHKKAILQDIKLPVLCCESGIYIRQRIKVPLELIHHWNFACAYGELIGFQSKYRWNWYTTETSSGRARRWESSHQSTVGIDTPLKLPSGLCNLGLLGIKVPLELIHHWNLTRMLLIDTGLNQSTVGIDTPLKRSIGSPPESLIGSKYRWNWYTTEAFFLCFI